MIGNDIVDLMVAKTQSNWERKGFLNKIFTEEERAIILGSNNPFQLVWLFWSMKESVYKIYVQKHRHRFFAPKKFKCELISEIKGSVNINNERYHTNTKITDDYIFTEAVEKNTDVTVRDYFELNNTRYLTQSKTVYQKLKKAISKIRNLPINTIHIKKNTVGAPELYQNNKLVAISFSISHHGRYGAYSIINTLK